MKQKLKLLLAALCGLSVSATVFGQDTFVWTNQTPTFPGGGNLGIAANWTNVSAGANGLASTANGDTLEWNGTTTGNLALTLSSGYNGVSGQPGINFYMNSNQTANLQIGPPAGVNGGTPRANGVLIDAGAGQFTLGDSSANTLEIVWGSAFTQPMENNSTNPAIIMPNLLWRMGGGFEILPRCPQPIL